MKKSKRNLIIIVAVVVVLGAFIGIKELLLNHNHPQPEADAEFHRPVRSELYTKYATIKSSNKIGLIVISYEGQCCPSTKEFLDKYNRQANQLIQKYKNQVSALFIDIGQLGNEQKNELTRIANEIGATRLPSLAILKKDGKLHQLFTGPFDINTVGNIIWKLSQS